jgi:cysteine-rich repeat protein
VTISEDPGVASVGFAFFAHRIDIIAAPATPEAPLVIAFRIDASQLPGNTDLSTIEVFKDGASVPPCVATDASAAPDPCVASRALAGDGDVEITVLTSTASAWSFGLCGNNVVEAGEQCDDGNQVDGDGCSRCSLDVSRLVPGSRAQITCALEWLVPGNLSPDGHGVPRGVVECTDDDPSCDFGAVQGDQACTFRVAMCFNVVDARLTCAVSNVRYLRLVQPSLNSKDPSDVSNRAALGKAPTQLGGTVEGVCANSSALSVASCALNSACNSGPGKRDGKCRRFIDFDPSLAASLQCSEFASIRVPLKRAGFGKGTRKLQLTALPEGSPVLGPALNADADSVKLVCKPRLQ